MTTLSKTNKRDTGERPLNEAELNADGPDSEKTGEAPEADAKGDTPPGDSKSESKSKDKVGRKTAAFVKTAADDTGGEEAEPLESKPGGETGPEETDADIIAKLNDELAMERDRYLRLAAEYDNYRKRSAKERETIYSDARADTIARLLPVYDNLDRALKMECADEAYYKGVEMTMSQLTQALENMNLSQIPTVGEQFDPNRHNAVMAIEDPELGEKIIAEEYQKGFMLGERVIRHSTVVVAN